MSPKNFQNHPCFSHKSLNNLQSNKWLDSKQSDLCPSTCDLKYGTEYSFDTKQNKNNKIDICKLFFI